MSFCNLLITNNFFVLVSIRDYKMPYHGVNVGTMSYMGYLPTMHYFAVLTAPNAQKKNPWRYDLFDPAIVYTHGSNET